jgi:DNA-binding transcriptional LysR family regulator
MTPREVAAVIELRSFIFSVLVADHLSFRKAAVLAGVRQSAISRRVRSLEDAIGVSIFQRRHGDVRPTAAGAEFVTACRTILREIDLAVSKAQMAGRGEAGYLRIGINASLSRGELRETLFDYLSRHPGVTVDIVEGQQPGLIAYINSRIVDIAILIGSVDRRVADTMTLWSERMMAAIPDFHALAARQRISWNDLNGERILLSREDHSPEMLHHLRATFDIRGQGPILVPRDLRRENILHCIGAERAISLVHDSGTGLNYPGVVFRDIDDDIRPALVHSTAYWSAANDNPSLRRFLSLLRERYPGVTVLPEATRE